jgi:rhomboid protease GluP
MSTSDLPGATGPSSSSPNGLELPPTSPHPVRLPVPRSRPVAAWVILGINILIWLAMTAMGGSTDPYILVRFGAKFNPLIVQGQVWRLVTPIFLHVGLVHLAFNSYAIYAIAPQIEIFFGTARFLAIYLLSGTYGVLLSFALSPHLAAGASGAIFGMIGTQAVFLYRYRDAFGWRGRRQFYNTLSVIATNLILTFAVAGIDIWGHIGGLVSGAALAWNIMPRYQVVMADHGPSIVDHRTLKQWGITVLAAVILLALSTWLAITFRGTFAA